MARQLVKNDDLIGVHASQAVGRQTPHALDVSRLGGVAQGVKTGAVQARAGEAVIGIFGHQLLSFLDHALAQQRELRTDGAARFLCVGRDPCIDRDSHRCVALDSRCSVRSLRMNSYAAAKGHSGASCRGCSSRRCFKMDSTERTGCAPRVRGRSRRVRPHLVLEGPIANRRAATVGVEPQRGG